MELSFPGTFVPGRGRPNVTLIVSAETETGPTVYALHSAETESRPKV